MNSKIKFYKQDGRHAVCIPLAILNVFKLVGSKANKSSKLYKTIKKRVDHIPIEGGVVEQIGSTLRSFGFRVKIRRGPTIKWLVDELRKGRVIIYSGAICSCGIHATLILGETPKHFIVVNAIHAPVVAYQPKKYYYKTKKFSHAVVVLLERGTA